MTWGPWRLVISIVAVALLGAAVARPAATAVAAQEGEDTFDFAQLDGVQQVVSRSYSADFAAMVESVTPGAEVDPSLLGGQGLLSLVALVAKFADGDSAEAGLNALADEFAAESAEVTGGAELEAIDLGDLGDAGAGYRATVEQQGVSVEVAILVVQQGEYVYVALGSTTGDEAVAPVTAAIEAMIAAEEGNDQVETDETGIHRGGLWDKLPRAGDDALIGLAPVVDDQLYPAEESDPAA